ncbi:TMEM175 family protein [Fructilactobacillus cliffordii]|uniref:TMEM175 family protein n=1 Tax=Fructilactobacillus cliffordii TaxID=2940299 RepID=UPI0020920203|nr:TMEM175 family protein [Fructilactobacillus cliffordii]USS86776.1 TMEM175 family protein [Fructilactobacillus cliffordii]
MNKSRLEAFTDAIIAIIVTIMILELKAPENPHFVALFEEAPYFFAYIVSALFIAVAWYNQHYMFMLATHISKKIYWLNNLWLFSMSLIPVSTAWVGRYINDPDPEIFYLLVFAFWSYAYLFLSKSIADELEKTGGSAAKVRSMFIYRFIGSVWFPVILVVLIVVVFFFPPAGLFIGFIEVILNGIRTNDDSDKLDQASN